jgi:glycosyltransferase involved in cell wall biosynthesis
VPKVTVLMPVRNGAAHVRSAVESILRQSLKDFEFLVIDDASTDNTPEIISSFSDPRVKLLANKIGLGVAKALNLGLNEVHGEYVLRMDADDISLPDRMRTQVAFLDQNPSVGTCGSWARFMGNELPVLLRNPVGPDNVKAYMQFANPICHPSAVIRKSVLDAHALRYNPEFSCSEDFDLWSRMSEFSKLDNIPQVLMRMRIHGSSVTRKTSDLMSRQTCEILKRHLVKLEIIPSPEQLEFHRRIGHGCRMENRDDILKAENWLLLLREANQRTGYHPGVIFDAILGMIWFKMCSNSGNLGFWILKRQCNSCFNRMGFRPVLEERLRFTAGVIWNTLTGSRGNSLNRSV